MELSFKLRTPIDWFTSAVSVLSSCVVFWEVFGVVVAFLSALSGELGTLGSALSHELVLELVLGVVVELTPTDGVFALELESDELLVLNVATETGTRTF